MMSGRRRGDSGWIVLEDSLLSLRSTLGLRVGGSREGLSLDGSTTSQNESFQR